MQLRHHYVVCYIVLFCIVNLFKKGDKVLLICLVPNVYYSAQHCTAVIFSGVLNWSCLVNKDGLCIVVNNKYFFIQ